MIHSFVEEGQNCNQFTILIKKGVISFEGYRSFNFTLSQIQFIFSLLNQQSPF